MNVGKGRLAVLGGAFLEKFNYDFVGGGGALDVGLTSSAVGWRAGVAYEIPDIAFRTELMYRSGTTHDASGSGNLTVAPGVSIPVPAAGDGELPQSVELKVQSGIAPGWLAFGSVRWTDWSVNETLNLNVTGVGTSQNQYYWRDGWTITGGVGHAFTDNVSGLVSLQWDRGVSTGYDFRTDKWLLAAGVSMKDSLGGELRLGGAVSYLASAEATKGIEAGNAVDSGWAGILSANYKVKW
jgi:long-chain fatty acid transport protein